MTMSKRDRYYNRNARFQIKGRPLHNVGGKPQRYFYTLIDTISGENKVMLSCVGNHPFVAPAFLRQRQAQLNGDDVMQGLS
jgi:hypothetical protein